MLRRLLWLTRHANTAMLARFCCLRRRLCCLEGWRVGHNPPFVFCGIQLSGLPAPSGRFFIGVCLPFPLAGRPFHRFALGILNNLTCIIVLCRADVSFLLRSQGSHLAPLRTLQFYLWAEFPQAFHFEGSKATHQLASQTS